MNLHPICGVQTRPMPRDNIATSWDAICEVNGFLRFANGRSHGGGAVGSGCGRGSPSVSQDPGYAKMEKSIPRLISL